MASPALRMVEREAVVFGRLWRGSVFSSFITPLLFLGAMGVGLGGLVDERNESVEGLSYLDFVTPGLLAASAMQLAAGDSLWPVMAGTKWFRTFHAMVASPLSAADVFRGFVAWRAVRAVIATVAFLVVAVALGGVASPWAVLTIPAAVLIAAAFSAPLAAFAATQETDLSFALIMRLVIVPLFLFSGSFFPISQLPDWAEPLAVVSPLWHGVELCRGATTGSIDALAAVGHVAVLVACTAAGAWWGSRTFARKLAP